MNIKKTLFSALLALGCFTASAQEQAKTEYVFNPHWYIQAQVGGQYTLGEISSSDLISPNAQLGVGYQFSKVIGARLSVNAWQSKAGINLAGYPLYNGEGVVPGYSAKWKWNYFAPMVDLTFNLSNLIGGYNPERLVNVSAFVGVGANIASGNDEALDVAKAVANRSHGNQNLDYVWDGSKTRLAGRAGLNVDFRLCDAVALGVELQANALNDKYNSKRSNNVDWYFNGLVGIKYNFGKTYSKHEVEPLAPVVVEKIVEKIVEKPVAQPQIEPLRRDIFFAINKTNITVYEQQKVREIAEYLQKYPNAKVEIIGYADKDTGTSTINARLADGRSKAVAEQLQSEYGISASRITFSSKGDTEQPYNDPALNRVSICIAK